jgi:hypothetical protein
MNTMKFPKNNFETKIRLKNYFREIGKLKLKLISVLWDKTKNWKMHRKLNLGSIGIWRVGIFF